MIATIPGEVLAVVDNLGGVRQAGGHVDHQEHPGLPGPAQHRGLIGEVILQVQVGVRVGQTDRHIFKLVDNFPLHGKIYEISPGCKERRWPPGFLLLL